MRFAVLLVFLLILAGCEQPSPLPAPSLVAIHATWCQPCQRDKPLLADVAREFSVTDIDFDSQRDLADGYHVTALPTYIIFSGKQEIMRTMNLQLAFQKLRSINQ